MRLKLDFANLEAVFDFFQIKILVLWIMYLLECFYFVKCNETNFQKYDSISAIGLKVSLYEKQSTVHWE